MKIESFYLSIGVYKRMKSYQLGEDISNIGTKTKHQHQEYTDNLSIKA